MSSPTVPAPRPPLPTGQWPPDGLEAVAACPVCGAAGRSVLHAGLRDRVFRTAPGAWRLVRCHGCRSGYLDPRPTPATIELAYRAYYTHPGAVPGPPVPNRVRLALAHDHRRSRWGYRQGPALPGGRLIAQMAPARAAIVDREIRHLPAIENGRLLDVGCGSGHFVAHMAALGWRAEGLDPDPTAVAGARDAGLAVTEGTLADLDDDAHTGAYDAVTLSHVIEHVHEPGAELRRICRLLRPGGLLWIGTPNLDSLGHRRFGGAWLGLDPPRHLVLFTETSLRRLLRESGFGPGAPPTPQPQAWAQFSQSAAIEQGRAPLEGPARDAPRLRALAALADRLARRAPRHAEELVVVARRP